MNRLNMISVAASSSAAVKTATYAKPAGPRQAGIARASGMSDGPLRRARFHDVVRPAFHFIVNPPEILAEDSDANELHAAEEEHGGDRRREPGQRLFTASQPPEHEEQPGGKTHERDEQPGIGQQPQRQMRKTKKPIQRIAH